MARTRGCGTSPLSPCRSAHEGLFSRLRLEGTRAPPLTPVACVRASIGSVAVALSVLAAVAATAGCDKRDSPVATDLPRPPAAANAAPIELPKIDIPQVRVRASGPTTVRVTWITPKGTAVNDDAPFRVRWNRSDGLADAPADVKSTGSAIKDGFRVKVEPMSGAPNATLDGEINIVVCDSATHSVCIPVRRAVGLGFVVAKDATEETTVAIPLPEARTGG